MAETVTSRQFWIQAPGRGEIVHRKLAPRTEDEVRVHTLFSGVSRGTESVVFLGHVPSSQRDSMRAPHQEGDFPAPVKYGYTSVGRVLVAPAAASELLGRIVFCLYPHQDLYHVSATAVHPVPERVPPGRAVLAANLETAVNAVWDARPCAGDRIAVVGGGVVGLLVAWLCRDLPGVDVLVVDTDPRREAPARRLGVGFSTAPELTDADLVFHASGDPAGLVSCLEMAGDEAEVIELSWYGSTDVPLPLGEAFHSRRLTIRSSQVGRIPTARRPRWDLRRRMGLALRLLRADELDVLITGEHEFDALPEVMSRLSRDPDGALCERIRYEPPDRES